MNSCFPSFVFVAYNGLLPVEFLTLARVYGDEKKGRWLGGDDRCYFAGKIGVLLNFFESLVDDGRGRMSWVLSGDGPFVDENDDDDGSFVGIEA